MKTHSQKRRLNVVSTAIQTEYQKADAVMAPLISGANVSCTKWCFACCKQLVSVSAIEMFPVVSKYPGLIRAKKKQIREQVNTLAPLVEKVFGKKRLTINLACSADVETYGQQSEALAALWWEQQLPCVFLNEDLMCGIYDVRPIVCRGHYVISDPKKMQ